MVKFYTNRIKVIAQVLTCLFLRLIWAASFPTFLAQVCEAQLPYIPWVSNVRSICTPCKIDRGDCLPYPRKPGSVSLYFDWEMNLNCKAKPPLILTTVLATLLQSEVLSFHDPRDADFTDWHLSMLPCFVRSCWSPNNNFSLYSLYGTNMGNNQCNEER